MAEKENKKVVKPEDSQEKNLDTMSLEELQNLEKEVRVEKKKHGYAGIHKECREIPMRVRAMKDLSLTERKAELNVQLLAFIEKRLG